MRDRNPLQVRFAGPLSIAAAGLLTGLASGQEVPVALWAQNSLGWHLSRGISIVDLVSDETPDLLVAACGSTCWAVLSDQGAGLRTAATAVSAESISNVTALPRVGSGPSTIAALRGSRLDLYAGASPVPTRTLDLGVPDLLEVRIVDLETDGTLEIVSQSELDLHVFDYETGLVEATLFGFGGLDLEVGNLDSDAAQEIAIASGLASCWALDGESLELDWATPSGCGNSLSLADVDGDGRSEVATPYPWPRGVRLFDPRTGALLFAVEQPDWEPFRIASGDLDGDGAEEIFFGDRQSGDLHALNAEGAEVWTVPDPAGSGGAGAIATGDLDGDGAVDVVWETGANIAGGPFGLGLAEMPSEELRGTLKPPGATIDNFDVGDLEGDGRVEAVTLVQDEDGGFAMILDGRDGTEIRGLPPAGYPASNDDAFALRVGDLTAGPELEIVTAYSRSSQPAVACQRADDERTLWEVRLETNRDPKAIEIADLDGDGFRDVVVPTYDHLDSSSHLYALEGATGEIKWWTRLGQTVGSARPLAVCELDGDAAREIVIAPRFIDRMWIVQGDSGQFVTRETESPTALICADLDQDGVHEIYATSDAGALGTIDFSTGLWTVHVNVGDAIWGAQLGDFVGDERPEFVLVADQRVIALDAEEFQVQAQSESFGIALGHAPARVWVEDLDGDGNAEALVSTFVGLLAVGFPYDGAELLVDGFESGDTVRWSLAIGRAPS